MTTINALKNLYKALGGDLDDVENVTIIPDMINAIAEVAGEKVDLPTVTAEDAGKVLTVNAEGEWEAATLINKQEEIKND